MSGFIGTVSSVVIQLLEIVGAALVVFGVWDVYPPAAFIVGGSALVAIASVADRR